MARKKRYQWDTEAGDALEATPSRSQKKRDSTALQALGEELAKLSLPRLEKLPLTPDLDEALRLLARIKGHEGRRRQMQYVGRLMRECDADAIREALDQLNQGQVQDNAAFHHAERLREALLQASAAELDTLLAPWPEQVEELRELIRAAKHESGPPHGKRALFRRLRELIDG